MTKHTSASGWLRLAGGLCAALLPALVFGAVETAPAPATGRMVPPVAVRRVAPEHPPELMKELVNGDVTLECLVDADGVVREVKTLDTTHPAFAEAAKVALEQWEFKPGTIDGKPAPIRIRVPFEFKLSPEQLMAAIAGRPVFVEVKEQVIPAGQLPSWPRPLQFYLPRYPAELEGSGKYGKAVINITINKEGKVINPQLVKATYPEFIIPSLVTAVKLEFPPQVMANQQRIYVNMDIQFDFKVPEKGLLSKAKADKSAAGDKAKKK
jgi:TonB family protein